MLALSRPVRSEEELTAWRVQAEAERVNWGPESPYIAETRDAAVAVLDWLLGESAVGPATGVWAEVADDTVVAQRLRAERLEAEGGDERHSARWYGRACKVLAYALKDPDVGSPL